MARESSRGTRASHPGDLGDELASFTRAMRANNVSPNTILAYGGAVRQFGGGSWSTTTRRVSRPSSRVTSRTGSATCSRRNKPATAHNRWRGLQRFFNWYAEKVDDFLLADAQAPPAAAAQAHAARPGDRRATRCPRHLPGQDVRGSARQRAHPAVVRHRRPPPRDRGAALLPYRSRRPRRRPAAQHRSRSRQGRQGQHDRVQR